MAESNGQADEQVCVEATEEEIGLEDGLDSVERHPNTKYYYDYFIDDKKEKWPTSENTQWITDDGTNVTSMLNSFRSHSYKAGRMMYCFSLERILALSFIFVINDDNINRFIGKYKGKASIIRESMCYPTRRIK